MKGKNKNYINTCVETMRFMLTRILYGYSTSLLTEKLLYAMLCKIIKCFVFLQRKSYVLKLDDTNPPCPLYTYIGGAEEMGLCCKGDRVRETLFLLRRTAFTVRLAQ